jgi:hypothetical protein
MELKMSDRESVKVLQECIDLQIRKGQDYQNPNSNVTQAMHYRRGIDSLHDIMQGKMYRAQSLLESNTANLQRPDQLRLVCSDVSSWQDGWSRP